MPVPVFTACVSEVDNVPAGYASLPGGRVASDVTVSNINPSAREKKALGYKTK